MIRWRSTQVALAGLESGIAGVCAASAEDRPRWFIATNDGRLRGVDLDDGSTFFDVRLPFDLATPGGATVVASADGRFVALAQSRGLEGAVYDVARGALLGPLARDDYHADVSGWALAFVRDDVLITATAWNRLEARALPSLERLAPTANETSLDYFWGHATPSPSGRQLASFGWYWHPIGALRVVDIDAWLTTKDESPTVPHAPQMADWWDDEVCWVDERRLLMRGQLAADDDAFFGAQEGVVLLDVATLKPERFFPGLAAHGLATDGRHLISLGETTQLHALDTGALVSSHPARTQWWHPGARVALGLDGGVATLHWFTGSLGTVHALPPTPGPENLVVLADALDEAGLDDAVVAHCRTPGPHGRRCWVIEGLR